MTGLDKRVGEDRLSACGCDRVRDAAEPEVYASHVGEAWKSSQEGERNDKSEKESARAGVGSCGCSGPRRSARLRQEECWGNEEAGRRGEEGSHEGHGVTRRRRGHLAEYREDGRAARSLESADEVQTIGSPRKQRAICSGLLLFLIGGRLARKSDAERAAKFEKALRHYGGAGIMGDLDDGPEQKPLRTVEVEDAILDLLPAHQCDLVLTHARWGEYTRHRRHEEVAKAVMALRASGRLSIGAIRMFAYEDDGGRHLPRPVENADVYTRLPQLVRHPQRHGLRPVPWLVADGYLADYQEVLDGLPLILVTSRWVKSVYARDGLTGKNIEVLPVGGDTDCCTPRDRHDPKVVAARAALGIS